MLLQILSTLLDKNSNSHYLITKIIPQECVTTRQCCRACVIFLSQNLSVHLCVKILRRIKLSITNAPIYKTPRTAKVSIIAL